MLTLKNVSRRMLVLQLDHGSLQEHESKAHAYSLHRVTVVTEDKRGRIASKTHQRMLPAALTFSAGEQISNLPNEVKLCAAVEKALMSGELRLISQDDSPVPGPVAPPPKAEEKKPTAPTTTDHLGQRARDEVRI